MATRGGARPGAGAPVRNLNAGYGRAWHDAIRKEVLRIIRTSETGEVYRKLDKLAEVVVSRALDGDMDAVKEIGNRLDGKPVQPVVVPEGSGPLQLVVNIRRWNDEKEGM